MWVAHYLNVLNSIVFYTNGLEDQSSASRVFMEDLWIWPCLSSVFHIVFIMMNLFSIDKYLGLINFLIFKSLFGSTYDEVKAFVSTVKSAFYVYSLLNFIIYFVYYVKGSFNLRFLLDFCIFEQALLVARFQWFSKVFS